MTYNNVLEIMLERFPELATVYKIEDAECGLYVVFGFSFMPYIINALLNQNEHKIFLEKLFDFFEEMAVSHEEKVKEILMYSVLETLGDDENILSIAEQYMCPETRKLNIFVQDFFGR